jgi:anti-sigma regulatory factor (Ser/Thr protein kinase)
MSAAANMHHRSYPAVPASVAEARAAVGDFAVAAGASEEIVEAVRLAVSEMVTNVVVHAYGSAPGAIHVTAAALENELLILVSDDGRGLQARTDSPGLGLGMALMSYAADDFSIVSRASGGTEVRISFNLGPDGRGPARAGAQLRGSVAAAARPASDRFSTTT